MVNCRLANHWHCRMDGRGRPLWSQWGPSVWDRTGNERLTLADLQVTRMKRGAAEKPPDIGRIPT